MTGRSSEPSQTARNDASRESGLEEAGAHGEVPSNSHPEQRRRPEWQDAVDALRDLTPLIAIVLTALSVYVAYKSFTEARSVARAQAEATAPILVPGTPLAQRGKTIGVHTDYAFVRKRADRLYVDGGVGRLVIPLRNGGSGIAIMIGLPVVVESCRDEPKALSTDALGQTLGSYVLPSGESDQLGYVPGIEQNARGSVRLGGKSEWYSFRYQAFARLPFNRLLIWYTDAAQQALRWTCITYQQISAEARGTTTAWAVDAQVYGKGPLPTALRIH